MLKQYKYKDKHCEYTYRVFEYNQPINPDLEIERIKLIKENGLHGTDVIENINENRNTLDPILPNNITIDYSKYEHMSGNVKYIDEHIVYKNIKLKIIPKLYKKINKDYDGNSPVDIDTLIWCLYYRYYNLASVNNALLSVLPEKYLELEKKHNACCELFSSFFNHTLKHFCSLFYDLEQYFGSRGNHFNFIPIRGFYLSNPPFTESIMTRATVRMLSSLDQNNKIRFFVTVPIWDKEGKEWVNEHCDFKVTAGYDFPIARRMIHHHKLNYYKRVCMENFKYFDYFRFKRVNAVSTYVFLFY